MLVFFRRLLLLSLFLASCSAFALWYLFTHAGQLPAELMTHVDNVWRGSSAWDGGRTNGELLRYAERRVSGHPLLESAVVPVLKVLQRHVERPVPEGELPSLGKGQQSHPAGETGTASGKRRVSTTLELRQAFEAASAGQTIEIQPGRYVVNERLLTAHAGSAGQPIVVRATRPGLVFIEINSEEGFKVTQPYWVFENLNIRGVCSEDYDCEHAFHVVGKARQTTIRNNRIDDFNAHVKVNGEDGDWPDDGRLEFNTLSDRHPRQANRPVTPFDLVAASRWRVTDNVVSNFVKADGDEISYGIFMKGAGMGGRIERNLVVCTTSKISQSGIRVGISFGGGGTDSQSCRDAACLAEHSAGLAANNIVAHCNDVGLDVMKGIQIVLAHNTLINTGGISIRGEGAFASVYGNLFEGQILTRKGGQSKSLMNEAGPASSFMNNPDYLNLAWRKKPETIPSLPAVPLDFCVRPRADATLPGALGGDAC
jgi:hypothetical protein